MASKSSPPDFGPVPEGTYTDDNDDETLQKLFYLERSERYSNDHTSWGYTLYRAVFGSGTDERFAKAVERLRSWVQWDVKQTRYARFRDPDIRGETHRTPRDPSLPHETDEIARRFWIEVIEEYPGDVRAGFDVEEGSEDFAAVGRAFLSWVNDHAKDPAALDRNRSMQGGEGDLYVRHDHCLIIDERALAAIELLPETPPEVKPRLSKDWGAIHGVTNNSWVWLLDRKTMQDQEDGKQPVRPRWMEPDHPPFPPWCRINIMSLERLWFGRPQGDSLVSWNSVVLEGTSEADYGKVRTWGGCSRAANEALAYSMKLEREEAQALQSTSEEPE